MHLVGVALAVLGGWLVLALPLAVLVGRFLRVGSERAQERVAAPISRNAVGRNAA